MPSGASRYGGPVYDATMHPAVADIEASRAGRLAADAALHHLFPKDEPARVYSHHRERSPNPTALGIMGLAQSRDQIERIVQRKDDLPFPGVRLGHTPSFSRAPNTNPVTPGFAHFTHHAHQIESKRATRMRFGR